MTKETYEIIHNLYRCTFLPGSSEKRFIKQLAALPENASLSEKQLLWLGCINYRYRKQVSNLRNLG